MDEVKKFSCKTNLLWTILAAALFGFFAYVVLDKAQTNEGGLIISGIIHLSPNGATIFYWSLFAACTFIVCASFYALAQSFMVKNPELEIHSDYFIVPPIGFFSKKKIFYKDIKKITDTSLYSVTSVSFQTDNEKATFSNKNFKSKEIFEQVIDEILSRSNNLSDS